MSSSGNRDVNLVIRAKNEASAGVNAAAKSLSTLDAAQSGAADSAKSLARELAALERSERNIGKSLDATTAAAGAQAERLLATNRAISERKARIEELGRALKLLQAESGKDFVGPSQFGDPKAVAAQISAIKRELGRAATQLNGRSGDGGLVARFEKERQQLGELRAAQRVYREGFAEVGSAVAQVTAELKRQNGELDKTTAIQARINRATGVDRAQSTLTDSDRNQIAGVLRLAEARDREILKLREQERATRELGETQAAQARAANLGAGSLSGKSARDSAAVFQEADAEALRKFDAQMKAAAADAKALDNAAASLRDKLNPLASIQERLAEETHQLSVLFKAGRISSKEYADGLALVKQRADDAAKGIGRNGLGGKPTLFGLKPYELQNLSFQINDIFTQLASGTSLSQTLAQQGGQLLQIFPRVGSAIVAAFSNPAILTFAATVGVIALSLKEASDQAARIKGFNGLIAGTGSGIATTAEDLNKAAEAIDRSGASTKDATAVVKLFYRDGLDPSRFEAFGRAAQDAAIATGKELPAAAKEMADAFTGGFDAIAKLDDTLNFLSTAEREQIRAMFESGQAARARNEAFERYAAKMAEIAAAERGPWADAAKALGNAWDGMIKAIADTAAINGIITSFDNLARSITSVLNRLSGNRTLKDIATDIANTQKELALAQSGQGAQLGLANPFNIERLQTKLGELRKEAAAMAEKAAKADAESARTGIQESAAQQKVNRQKAAELDLENELQKLRDKSDKGLSASEEKRRAFLAGQLAYNDEILSSGSELIANKKRELAVEKEITAARKQQQSARDKQVREWSQDLGNSSNDALVATARRFSGMNETANRGSLQDFFKSNGINVDPKMTAWCAAFVNAVLATNGIAGTGSLSAKSFLGFGQEVKGEPKVGDIVILNRGGNPSDGHVGFFQGFDAQGRVKVLGGNQKDGVNTQSFSRNDVVGVRRAPSQGDIAQSKFKESEATAKRQKEFNEDLDAENDKRRLSAQLLREQIGLSGEALIAKQREQAIAEAVQRAELKARDAGVNVTDEQVKQIKETTAALFDQAHAQDVVRERWGAINDRVDILKNNRDALQERITGLLETGQSGTAAQLQPLLDTINKQLLEATSNAEKFLQSLSEQDARSLFGDEFQLQIQAIIQGFEAAKQKVIEFQLRLGSARLTGQQLAETFSGAAVNAIDRFAQAVAGGANVFKSLRAAILETAAEFLRQIARMIIQQLIFNAVAGFLSGFTGGATAAAGGGGLGVAPVMVHSGGVIGGGGLARHSIVSPGIFASATRYHTGGMAGLRPDEVPAILQKGEEVLTADDPRHRNNGGSGAAPNIKIVNTIDAGDFVSQGLGSKVGEKAILNFMRSNSRAVKAALG